VKIDYRAAEDCGFSTLRELRVLYLIHTGEANEVRTLAAMMGVQRPCIVRALDAIEAKGYGIRLPHKTDMRCMTFMLTTGGIAAAKEIFR
jgi:DNA-binding MarR family transcriptional regulator